MPDVTRLTKLRIASPCHERWEAMRGDDRVRHCDRCDKDVHDLSAMSAAEADALLAAAGARPCLRLHRRADGRVITGDCPEGARLRRRRRVTAIVAPIAAAVLGAAALLVPDDADARKRSAVVLELPVEEITGEAPVEPSRAPPAPPAAKSDPPRLEMRHRVRYGIEDLIHRTLER